MIKSSSIDDEEQGELDDDEQGDHEPSEDDSEIEDRWEADSTLKNYPYLSLADIKMNFKQLVIAINELEAKRDPQKTGPAVRGRGRVSEQELEVLGRLQVHLRPHPHPHSRQRQRMGPAQFSPTARPAHLSSTPTPSYPD